jgi:hypothetical protein
LALLESDPGLFGALQRRTFIEKGLELVDGSDCPLCDSSWESEQHLRHHLKAKLVKSKEASKVQQELLKSGATIGRSIVPVVSLLVPVQKLALLEGDTEFSQLIANWKADLEDLRTKLGNVDGLIGLKSCLSSDWMAIPTRLAEGLQELTLKIEAKPDQSATIEDFPHVPWVVD